MTILKERKLKEGTEITYTSVGLFSNDLHGRKVTDVNFNCFGYILDANCQIQEGFIENNHEYLIIRDMSKKCNIEIKAKLIKKIEVTSRGQVAVVLLNKGNVTFDIIGY